jgi:hypothetical protein
VHVMELVTTKTTYPLFARQDFKPAFEAAAKG